MFQLQLAATLLLAALSFPGQQTSAPRAGKAAVPSYRADARFDEAIGEDLKFRSDECNPAEAVRLVAERVGVPILAPGPGIRFPLRLPPDRRRLRDILDAVADLAQGSWNLVDGAYVLVIDPHLLDIAASDGKDRITDWGLSVLVGSLEEKQKVRFLRGFALTQITLNSQQQRYLADLGAMAYYTRPYRHDPKAVRGRGVSVKFATGEVQLWIPVRDGKPVLWRKIPLPAAGSGAGAAPSAQP